MEIAGLQLIRGNISLETGVLAGETVKLSYGDTLRVNVSFDYRGPVGKATLYGAIGVRGVGFDEQSVGQVEIDLPQSLIFTPLLRNVDIAVSPTMNPGTNYDLYCKLLEYPEAGMPEKDNVIEITGIPPTYTLIQDTIYPSYYTYDGMVEISIFSARIAPFTPSNWAAKRFASEIKKGVEAEGSRVIEMKVYADITPLLWTDIKIELTVTPVTSNATAGRMTEVSPFVWPLVVFIIRAVLAIIGILVITWGIISIIREFKHQPLSEVIKKTWDRESLYSVIGDFEKELGRTPTPPEELDKQSDQQLRSYCDELANVIAPPGFNWMPWAIGGVAALGVGGLAMAAIRKPRAAIPERKVLTKGR